MGINRCHASAKWVFVFWKVDLDLFYSVHCTLTCTDGRRPRPFLSSTNWVTLTFHSLGPAPKENKKKRPKEKKKKEIKEKRNGTDRDSIPVGTLSVKVPSLCSPFRFSFPPPSVLLRSFVRLSPCLFLLLLFLYWYGYGHSSVRFGSVRFMESDSIIH